MRKHDAPDIGEHEVASRALEQLLAELLFERADLSADRRLRETQPSLARAIVPSRATVQK